MKQLPSKVFKKVKTTKKVPFKSFSSSTSPKNLFNKNQPSTGFSNNASVDKKTIAQQTWWHKLTNFLNFNKSTQQPALETTPFEKPNFFATKIKAEETNNQNSNNSYWNWRKWLAGAIGATVVGGTVATMSGDENLDDPLLRPEFKELRKFIELTKDPELEKRWNICKANSKCHEVILNANLITIINQKPYIALKDHQFDRLINAKILEYVIKKYKLNLIAIPRKSILFDGHSWKLVSEVIQEKRTVDFSKEQLNQLMILVKETGYSDIAARNCIVKNGKVYLIDTENLSFREDLDVTIGSLRCLGKYEYRTSSSNKKIVDNTIMELERKIGLNEYPPFYPQSVIKLDHIDNLNIIRKQAKDYENLINKGERESGHGNYRFIESF
jgi:hypothetical protein